MTSAIDPSVIGAGNIDKAAVQLQLTRARDEITALQTAQTALDAAKVNRAGDTMTGDLIISKANPGLALDKALAAESNSIYGRQATSNRWRMILGGSTTSDFTIERYNDSGVSIDVPLNIARDTGAPSFANPALWRTGLGASVVGNLVFTATDTAAARSSIAAPPLPTVSAGVGQWVAITTDGSGNYTLPVGGTWAYFWSNIFATVSISPGGTQIITGEQATITRGFAWRIA